MSDMHFHLVGGFLGSGKTTGIISAIKHLMSKGKRIGVVTNDQGKYLVDTAFFRAQNLPTVEVTGGCFCCNYDDLAARLHQLQESALPDVIFAESVGSCADVVATVVKPFLDLKSAGIPLTSYSVFTDIRMLRRRLRNQPMPFSDDVVYIFDKQIEESGLLIINKTDLLAPVDVQTTVDLTRQAYPNKTIWLQNSRSVEDVMRWVELIETDTSLIPQTSVDIDYERYGTGEAELAWFDATVSVHTPEGTVRACAISAIRAIQMSLLHNNLPLGHVKFMIVTEHDQIKLSLPTLDANDWDSEIPSLAGETLHLLINARVQTQADNLKSVIESALTNALAQAGAAITHMDVAYFHPGFPHPTHRMA